MADLGKKVCDMLYQSSQVTALPFEKAFVAQPAVDFARNNWPLAFGIVIAYLFFITVGSRIMQSMKAFDLRLALAGWNAFLCIFSFIGMCKTMPYLIASIMSQSYDKTVCTHPSVSWGNGPTGFWVMLFIYSKIPELIDTVFIVLRKKPLIFLHWYHHVTVLLFCWSAYSTMAGSGLYFVAMNYSVHALMYGYYCLQALGVCPKSFPAILITMSQILQMFVGTGVCISCWYFKYSGRDCANETSNLIAGAVMYGSYLYLFCDFAVRRYVFPQKKAPRVKKLD